MNMYVRTGILGLLVIGAVVSAAAAVGGVLARAPRRESAEVYEYQWSCPSEEAEFVLREYGGCIGVFSPEGASRPVSVTDIPVTGLRDADRAMLEQGIAVRDSVELMTLLEDLGS